MQALRVAIGVLALVAVTGAADDDELTNPILGQPEAIEAGQAIKNF